MQTCLYQNTRIVFASRLQFPETIF